MKSGIALVLLVLGVCLAATSGSRLGEEQASRTPLSAQAAVAGGIVAGVARCDDAAEKAGLRIARELEQGELTAADAAEQRAAVEPDRATCRDKAVAPWNGDLGGAETALAEAKAFLAAQPRLEPATRLSEWFAQGALGWLAGLVLIVAGAVLGRNAAREQATAPAHGTSTVPTMEAALVRLRETIATALPEVQALNDNQDSPKVRAAIEAMEVDVLTPLVEDRGRYQARHGVAAFAEYFGPFSAGERNMARAWSALTDGYPHVAADALQAADLAFSQAQAAYQRVNA